MHELLAPILYVMEQDALDRLALPDDATFDELMAEMLDASYIEHDAYILFSKLMEHAQSFYEVKDSSSTEASTPSSQRYQEQSSAIVERSKFIHDVCLHKVDPELAGHLTSIEILPQIFLMCVLLGIIFWASTDVENKAVGCDFCLAESFPLSNP